MKILFFLNLLCTFALFLNAQQLTYVSRAIGNSTHKTKGPHMQNHIQDMVVDADGTCRTYSVWDEGNHSRGVYRDGVYIGNGSLAKGSSKSVVDQNGNTWTINNFYGRFLDATKNSYPNWRVDPVPTGSNKPTITCSDGRAITSIADPVALGINRTNGQLLVADNGIDQNIKIFDISGTPSQIGTFGKQGGIWGDPVPGRATDMLRFRGITGVGTDNSGNIYVAMDGYPGIEGSGGGAEIRALNPDGTLRWRMVGFIFVSTGTVDPETDGADIYSGYHHFKMDYSKPQGFNSDWSHYSISIDPFKYPNDPRLVTSCEDAHTVLNINGKKYMYLTDMYNNMLWVYRFDGEIAVPCAAFCVHFGWNGDEYRMNSWNYTRGRPITPEGGRVHWMWVDLNGDGSGMNQSNEYEVWSSTLNQPNQVNSFDIDTDGNVYIGRGQNGDIYKFPTNGFDSNGNPRYSVATKTTFANVGHGAYSMEWVQENDMFVIGNGDDIKTVSVWQNWSNSSRSKAYSVTLPTHGNGDARQVTADKDYFYVTYLMTGGPKTGKQGEIDVYKMSDGSFLGYIIPGPEVGSVSGWIDMTTSTHVFVTSSGKRIITVEEAEVGKILVYEWTPNITGIPDITDSESDTFLFPNPFSSGSLLIRLPESAIQFSIFDSTGKKIYHENVTKGEFTIDHSIFKTGGVYIICAATPTNSVNKRLIVMK